MPNEKVFLRSFALYLLICQQSEQIGRMETLWLGLHIIIPHCDKMHLLNVYRIAQTWKRITFVIFDTKVSPGNNWYCSIQCLYKMAESLNGRTVCWCLWCQNIFQCFAALTVSECHCLSVSLTLCWPVCLHLSPSIRLDACPTNHQGKSILHSFCLSVVLSLTVCLFTLSPCQPPCHLISVSFIRSFIPSIHLFGWSWRFG